MLCTSYKIDFVISLQNNFLTSTKIFCTTIFTKLFCDCHKNICDCNKTLFAVHWVAVFMVTSLVRGLAETYRLLPVVRRVVARLRDLSVRRDRTGTVVEYYRSSVTWWAHSVSLAIAGAASCVCALLYIFAAACIFSAFCYFAWTTYSLLDFPACLLNFGVFKLILNCTTSVEAASYCHHSVEWSWLTDTKIIIITFTSKTGVVRLKIGQGNLGVCGRSQHNTLNQ
jgi:uncharacterized membrane protein YvlD (DUF360 family)